MKKICVWLVKLYQKYISPLHRRCCIYTPTCSQYTIEAIEKHGAVKGCYMGLKRILRCNPFSEGGYDPVPENLKGDIKWLL